MFQLRVLNPDTQGRIAEKSFFDCLTGDEVKLKKFDNYLEKYDPMSSDRYTSALWPDRQLCTFIGFQTLSRETEKYGKTDSILCCFDSNIEQLGAERFFYVSLNAYRLASWCTASSLLQLFDSQTRLTAPCYVKFLKGKEDIAYPSFFNQNADKLMWLWGIEDPKDVPEGQARWLTGVKKLSRPQPALDNRGMFKPCLDDFETLSKSIGLWAK